MSVDRTCNGGASFVGPAPLWELDEAVGILLVRKPDIVRGPQAKDSCWVRLVHLLLPVSFAMKVTWQTEGSLHRARSQPPPATPTAFATLNMWGRC